MNASVDHAFERCSGGVSEVTRALGNDTVQSPRTTGVPIMATTTQTGYTFSRVRSSTRSATHHPEQVLDTTAAADATHPNHGPTSSA